MKVIQKTNTVNFNHSIKAAIATVLSIVMLFSLCCCSPASNESTGNTTITATVSKDEKFGSADLDISEDDIANAGFALGDSCNIEFSNGVNLSDVPYYNGYYTKDGMPVIVAYPKSEHVTIAYTNGNFWSANNLSNGDTVKITLTEKAKYKTTQDTLSQTYSVERKDYSSDAQFSNFRALKGGKLKKNFLYRGASPVNNSRNRASITNSLVEKKKIKSVMDLSDTDKEMKEYFSDPDFTSNYTKKLYKNKKDITLGMSTNKNSDEFKASLAKGLRFIIKNDGPIYIHCTEGKDRTGFVCMLLEALAGSTYSEMQTDYMKTYENYYGISKETNKDKYDAISSLYFDSFFTYLNGEDNAEKLKNLDFVSPAEKYLKSCGLNSKEIKQLHALIEK